jgi:hypothetical protein
MKIINFTTNSGRSRESVMAMSGDQEPQVMEAFTWTGYVTGDDESIERPDCEEIDVTAWSLKDARAKIEKELHEGYDPGMRIVVIEKRVGYYF